MIQKTKRGRPKGGVYTPRRPLPIIEPALKQVIVALARRIGVPFTIPADEITDAARLELLIEAKDGVFIFHLIEREPLQ